jgi:hypothetical protein
LMADQIRHKNSYAVLSTVKDEDENNTGNPNGFVPLTFTKDTAPGLIFVFGRDLITLPLNIFSLLLPLTFFVLT